jgi:hypothetical protein
VIRAIVISLVVAAITFAVVLVALEVIFPR